MDIRRRAEVMTARVLIIGRYQKASLSLHFVCREVILMKAIEVSKKTTFKPEPVTLFSFGRGTCPQTGSNCGFIRKTCKVYCWLK
jgi:hypothetical protein